MKPLRTATKTKKLIISKIKAITHSYKLKNAPNSAYSAKS